MANSQLIIRRIAEAVVGLGFATLFMLLVGRLWQEMALPSFGAFILFWGLAGLNTIALQRRNPDLVSSLGWKKVKTRYKPLELGEDEYEITFVELMRGQIAFVFLGIPIASVIAGLGGMFFALNRWTLFFVAFALWAAVLGFGMIGAILNR